MRHLVAAFLVVAAVFAAACGSGEPGPTVDPGGGTPSPSSNSLSGTVELGELDGTIIPAGARLPDGAVVVVTLADVSRTDVASEPITRQTVPTTAIPFDYELTWSGNLVAGRTYAVSARIEDADDNLLYINDTAFDITPGQTTQDFWVIAVS
ncbi:YbaY family lipoprotein [Candidatus Poriferisocius sp.]|uniref:YbaY family lipoprotein n=1 Tax=Candidatus Poriferisocius sp. TaxID=3101276 RepID=UPI003B5AFFCD